MRKKSLVLEKHLWVTFCTLTPIMSPDQESNPWPFGLWDKAPNNWATLARPQVIIYWCLWLISHLQSSQKKAIFFSYFDLSPGHFLKCLLTSVTQNKSSLTVFYRSHPFLAEVFLKVSSLVRCQVTTIDPALLTCSENTTMVCLLTA